MNECHTFGKWVSVIQPLTSNKFRSQWLIQASYAVLQQLFIKFAGNEDMPKISDEFELRPDRTTDYRVNCPWESKTFPIDLQWKNALSMLAHSFLIESSSKLLVTRTGIKAWASSILDQIRPPHLELLALERRTFYTFELKYLWSQLANLDQILFVASLGWGGRLHMVFGQIRSKSRFPWQQKAPIYL